MAEFNLCRSRVIVSALELKIPPMLLVLLFGLAMWLVAFSAPSFRVSLPWRTAIAVTFAVAGALISLSGVVAFRHANTTVNPTKPGSTSALVTTSIYRATRNPMYLGFLLVLLAWAAYLAHVFAFALLPGFVLYMNRFQIWPEERTLSAKFGSEFSAYKENVRRWL